MFLKFSHGIFLAQEFPNRSISNVIVIFEIHVLMVHVLATEYIILLSIIHCFLFLSVSVVFQSLY